VSAAPGTCSPFTDICDMGLERLPSRDRAAPPGTAPDCVYISFDIDCIDAGFRVPVTGCPNPAACCRASLKLLELIVAMCRSVGPRGGGGVAPYDHRDMTCTMANSGDLRCE